MILSIDELLPTSSEHKKYSSIGNNNVVFYHANCLDGYGAAWCLHTYFALVLPTNVWYVPVQYNNYKEIVARLLPFLNLDIYVVDFSFDFETIQELEKVASSITIIDHHIGAKAELGRIKSHKFKIPVEVVFSNDMSGAGLVWNHFFNGPPPRFIECIQDRDLWKFEIEYTKEVCTAIQSRDFNLDDWDQLSTQEEGYSIDKLINDGKALLRSRTKDVAAHCVAENLTFSDFDYYAICYVNAPWYVSSEVCQSLLDSYPDIDIAASYYIASNGVEKWSFRSRKNGVYLPDLLAKYGGGGHASAAGVTINKNSKIGIAFTKAFQQRNENDSN